MQKASICFFRQYHLEPSCVHPIDSQQNVNLKLRIQYIEIENIHIYMLQRPKELHNYVGNVYSICYRMYNVYIVTNEYFIC